MSESKMFLNGEYYSLAGRKVYVREWRRDENSWGTVLIVHGLGEHGARYRYVADRLTAIGLRVRVVDLWGHGRSDGIRGHMTSYEEMEEVIVWAVEQIQQQQPGAVFIYGHSMGGQLVVNTILDKKLQVNGVILSAPWLGLAMKSPWWKLLAGQIAARVYPAFTFSTKIDKKFLVNGEFLEELEEEEAKLLHQRISAGLYAQMVQGSAVAMQRASEFTTPLFLYHGTEDCVTCLKTSVEFYESCGAKEREILIVDEMGHEGHQGEQGVRILDAICKWLKTKT